MIIFLYGPDDYRREEKKRWFIKEFKKKYSGLSVGTFDALASDGVSNIQAFLRSQSIFETKKLAVLENAFEEKIREDLGEIIRPLVNEKNITVLLSERKAPVKALAFLLEKPALSQAFAHLIGAEWEAFITGEAKKSGIVLDLASLHFLAGVYKENSWGLVTELQKLAGLGKATITKKELDAFDLEAAPDYWAILNGLKGREVKSRLWALEKMLAMGDPPPKIFNILASQWREKTSAMAEYDVKIKSGKLEYEEALVDLVIG